MMELKNGMEVILRNGKEFDVVDGYIIDKDTKHKINIEETYDEDLLVKNNINGYDSEYDIMKVKFSIDCDYNNCECYRTEDFDEYIKSKKND